MEPTIKVPTPEQSAKLKQLKTTLAGYQSVLNKPLAKFDAEREQCEAPLRKENDQTGRLDVWRRLKPDSAESSNGTELKIQDDDSVLAAGKLPNNDAYKLTFSTNLENITGFRLETLTDPSLKNGGPGRDGNFVLTDFELQPGVDELDLGSLEQRFDSGVMKKGAKRIDTDITGQQLLVLDVTDAGNGISSDWANWGEPILEGPDGSLKLTDLDWHSATTDYREVLKNRNAKGELQRIDGRPLKWGIGTHAKSRVVFVLPEGYTRFKATVGPDTGALEEVPNAQTSIRFFVRVSTKGQPGKLKPLLFASAIAEFNQDGLPVTGAIDDDPKSGWGIWKKDFDYNQPRKAVFRLAETWSAGKGTRFTLRLRHQHDAKKHLLGRFRVSATTAPTGEPACRRRSSKYSTRPQPSAWPNSATHSPDITAHRRRTSSQPNAARKSPVRRSKNSTTRSAAPWSCETWTNRVTPICSSGACTTSRTKAKPSSPAYRPVFLASTAWPSAAPTDSTSRTG